MLPFTREEFFEVFKGYNLSVWPAQAVILALGLLAVLFATGKVRGGRPVVNLVLSFLWIWMGAVYHLRFFTPINPAAYLFGALFLAEGALFLFWGALQGKVGFRYPVGWRGPLGAVLMAYAVIGHPLLGSALGHHYPSCPTFGLPCPTTLFTFGLLCWADGKAVRGLLVVPWLWALVGSVAAFSLGVWEDLGLLAAGAAGLALWLGPGPKEAPP